MGKITIKTFLPVLAVLLLPFTGVWAAGLGKLTVMTGLGQPLRAEIEIVSLQQGEGDSLAVRQANQQLYRDANIELSPSLSLVKLAIVRKGEGRYAVAISSVQPVNDPFLDMLVELSWSGGRLVREYTFLLDPPEYKGPQPVMPAPAAASPARPLPAETPAQPVTPPPAAQPEALPLPTPVVVPLPQSEASPPQPEVSPPPPETRPLPAETPPQPELRPLSEPKAEEAAPPGASTIYEVKRGDTLTKIANANMPEGVTLQQMLIALYRGNREMFDGDNINRIRAGKVLNIPDREAADSVDPKDAQRLVIAQAQDFNEYRRKLGIAVAEAPAKPETGSQTSGGKITAPAADKPAPAAVAKDQLKLSKADTTASGGKPAADDLIAKDKALKEANERVADLEKNVKDMQKALELSNKTMADLQKQAQAKPAPVSPPAPAAKADAAKAPVADAGKAAVAPDASKAPAAKAADAAKVPVVADAGKAPAAPDASKAPEAAKAAGGDAGKAPPAVPAADAGKAAPTAEAAKAAAAPKAAAPKAEASFIDDLLADPMMLAGGGGVFLLLVGYAVYAWKKKVKNQFGNSVMGVSSPMDTSSVFGASGGRNVDTGSSQFQTDFSQGGIGAIDTDEVDPIAEADVYMAYGRDAQAEEILKEALQKDSSRLAVRAKLLEIYATRKDLKAFESSANELSAASGGKGPEWEKAVALGLSIDPENPLYGGKRGEGIPEAAPTYAASAIPDIPLDAGSEQAAPAALDIDLDLGATPTQAPSAIPDIPLDAPSAPAADAPLDLGFDFNMESSAKPAEEKSDFNPGGTLIIDGGNASAPAASSGGLDINFELPGAAVPAAPAPVPASASNTIDFDLNLGGDSPPAAAAPKAPEMDLSSISLDLGSPGDAAPAPAGDAHWQEVATKLDLAKAYEEMGDKDGARDLLKEVMKEGDSAQQQKAQTMLQTLG